MTCTCGHPREAHQTHTWRTPHDQVGRCHAVIHVKHYSYPCVCAVYEEEQ